MAEPVWALATLFPSQGHWRDEEYLAFAAERPRVELSDGRVEVLPMPTDHHQAILKALLFLLDAYARRTGGKVRSAGLRVRLRPGRFREPDLVFLSAARLHLRGEEFWSGADLVVEIVSGGAEDRVRDLVTKRHEYAEAGIPEYWIVDPDAETITVLALRDGAEYAVHGVFERGAVATSAAFDALSADVNAVLDAD
jgi:Uma2 family endonuclease